MVPDLSGELPLWVVPQVFSGKGLPFQWATASFPDQTAWGNSWKPRVPGSPQRHHPEPSHASAHTCRAAERASWWLLQARGYVPGGQAQVQPVTGGSCQALQHVWGAGSQQGHLPAEPGRPHGLAAPTTKRQGSGSNTAHRVYTHIHTCKTLAAMDICVGRCLQSHWSIYFP